MKIAAVCGGACELGQVLCQMLKDAGYWPKIYDRVYAPGQPTSNNFEHYIFDLTNEAGFFGSFQWNQFDVVFQIAKPSNDILQAEAVVQSLKINMNVLEACKLFGVRKALTILDMRSLTAATIETLYRVYAKDYGIQTTAFWSWNRDRVAAKQLINRMNQLDAVQTT